MRLFIVAVLIAVPCLCAAAPVTDSEEVLALMATVRSEKMKPPFARQHFEDGVSAWTSGHYLVARNHWLRAQAWLVRTRPAKTPAREALATLVAAADVRSQPESTPEPEIAAPAPRPRARRRARRAPVGTPAAVDARSVMDRARAAERAGEVEKAARLMRIASQLPGGESAGAKAEALEAALDRRGDLVQPAR